MCKDNKEKNVGLLMAMSGDIFACHSVGRGCSWPVVGRTRDTTEHSTMQRTISTAFLHLTKKKKNYPTQDVQIIVKRLGNPL